VEDRGDDSSDSSSGGDEERLPEKLPKDEPDRV